MLPCYKAIYIFIYCIIFVWWNGFVLLLFSGYQANTNRNYLSNHVSVDYRWKEFDALDCDEMTRPFVVDDWCVTQSSVHCESSSSCAVARGNGSRYRCAHGQQQQLDYACGYHVASSWRWDCWQGNLYHLGYTRTKGKVLNENYKKLTVWLYN